jgi:hypothetical protein
LKALKILLLLLVAAGAGFYLYRHAPIPQPESYHAFADTRTMYRIPNTLNVLSNIAFALVGLLGLRFLARGPSLDPDASFRPGAHTAFDSYRERPAYVIFFAGVFLTAVGSAFYHLVPSTPRLFWDRLPMAIAFMSLFATVIAERISIYWSRNLLLPLIAAGVASVVMWRISEQRGAGDLRAYVFVQGFPMVALPLMMLLFRSRYTHGWMLLVVVVFYGGAKAFEHFDAQVFDATGRQVSGHSLKHVVAAIACYVVVMMLKRRGLAPVSPTGRRPAYMLSEEEEEEEVEKAREVE